MVSGQWSGVRVRVRVRVRGRVRVRPCRPGHRLEHCYCELARVVLGVVPLGDDAVEELAASEQLHDEVQHRRRLVHLVQLDAATDGAPRAASGHGARHSALRRV